VNLTSDLIISLIYTGIYNKNYPYNFDVSIQDCLCNQITNLKLQNY